MNKHFWKAYQIFLRKSNLRSKKWLLPCSYDPNTNLMADYLHCIGKGNVSKMVLQGDQWLIKLRNPWKSQGILSICLRSQGIIAWMLPWRALLTFDSCSAHDESKRQHKIKPPIIFNAISLVCEGFRIYFLLILALIWFYLRYSPTHISGI